MGTIYVSGIPEDIEEAIRYLMAYDGEPHHTIMKIFYKVMMGRSWLSWLVPKEKEELVRQKLYADPDLRAAFGARLPEAGRLPSYFEIASVDAVGHRVDPMWAWQLAELQEKQAQRGKLAKAQKRIKDAAMDFVLADEEDDK